MRFVCEEIEDGFAVEVETEAEARFAGVECVRPFAHGTDLVGGAGVDFVEAVAGEVAGAGVVVEEGGEGGVGDVFGCGFVEDVVGHYVADDAAAFLEVQAGFLGDCGVGGCAMQGDALGDVVVVYGLEGPGVVHLLASC